MKATTAASPWMFMVFASLTTAVAAEPCFPTFKPLTVDSHIGIGYGVTVADVDGDGKPDILLADKDEIVWYQNPTWAKHVLVPKLTPHDFVCLAAKNRDDGKLVVAAGAEWNPSDTLNSGGVFYLILHWSRATRWPAATWWGPVVTRL